MKFKETVQKFKSVRILRNKKGQGIIEYVLLAVVVLALVGIFKDKIRDALTQRTETLGNDIQGFTGE
ncbi:MAG: hypothetical protein ACK5P5_12220 [Pseudobdellovibrionaceae bacterium]